MDSGPRDRKSRPGGAGRRAAAALVQQDPSSQIELELPIDAFAGDADHQKQIHQDFWQGFDPKDLGRVERLIMRRLVALRPRPRPLPSTRRRALTSTKERSKASREDDQRLYHRAKMDGALNDEPTKHPMLDAVLGAAVALFFGGGTYALFLRSSGQLSIPADRRPPVRRKPRARWRKKFTDEELEWLGDNRPTKAQEAAILAAVAEIIEAAPVVVFSAPDCPCGSGRPRDPVAFTEVKASDRRRAQLTKRTGADRAPGFAGGELAAAAAGPEAPFAPPHGVAQEMAARAAGAQDREKRGSLPATSSRGCGGSSPPRRKTNVQT